MLKTQFGITFKGEMMKKFFALLFLMLMIGCTNSVTAITPVGSAPTMVAIPHPYEGQQVQTSNNGQVYSYAVTDAGWNLFLNAACTGVTFMNGLNLYTGTGTDFNIGALAGTISLNSNVVHIVTSFLTSNYEWDFNSNHGLNFNGGFFYGAAAATVTGNTSSGSYSVGATPTPGLSGDVTIDAGIAATPVILHINSGLITGHTP